MRSPSIVGSSERCARALELKRAGKTFEEIGVIMGSAKDPAFPITRQGAELLVRNRLKYERLSAEDFGPLSTKTRRALERSGITSLESLQSFPLSEIANLPGMGVRSLAEVEKLLESRR